MTKILIDEATVKLALDAQKRMKLSRDYARPPSYQLSDADKIMEESTAALREALASGAIEQPLSQARPVTAITRYELLKMARAAGLEKEFVVDPQSEQRFRLFAQIAVSALAEQPAQQQIASTITITQRGSTRTIDNHFEDCVRDWPDGEYKLYTSPQAQRNPLTNLEGLKLAYKHHWLTSLTLRDAYILGIRDAEAAHGIKENT